MLLNASWVSPVALQLASSHPTRASLVICDLECPSASSKFHSSSAQALLLYDIRAGNLLLICKLEGFIFTTASQISDWGLNLFVHAIFNELICFPSSYLLSWFTYPELIRVSNVFLQVSCFIVIFLNHCVSSHPHTHTHLMFVISLSRFGDISEYYTMHLFVHSSILLN